MLAPTVTSRDFVVDPLQLSRRQAVLPFMRMLTAIATLTLAATFGSTASAQVIETYRVRAGLGVQAKPEYLGSDKLNISPFPSVSFAKGDEPFGFGAHDDSLGVKLFGSGGFSVGPAAKLRSGRKNSDAGAPLGKVSRTIEIGAFVEQDVSDSFRVRGEVLKGLGGHEGLVGSLGADKVWRDGDKYLFAIGPRVRLADEKFQRAFFGISPEAALATGQPIYRPGGGIYAVGLTSSANYDLGGNWGLFGYAAYDRLVGDAKKSPVVRDYGSANQLSAGIGVSHTFNIRL